MPTCPEIKHTHTHTNKCKAPLVIWSGTSHPACGRVSFFFYLNKKINNTDSPLQASNTNLDRVEINENVFKLFQEKEAGGHALSARNSIWKDRKCNTHMLTHFPQIIKQVRFLWGVPHSLAEPPTSWKNCWAIFKWSLWNTKAQLHICLTHGAIIFVCM